MPSTFKHTGVIVAIKGDMLKVKITQTSACATCSVKEACHVSEQKEKCIDIPFDKSKSHYRIGDTVTVTGKSSTGLKAVALAFVIPFCILMAVLALCLHLAPGKEAEAALISIACLIPYYIGLYAIRKKLSRIFIFELEN